MNAEFKGGSATSEGGTEVPHSIKEQKNLNKRTSHLDKWIRDRLEVLAGIFAVDVMAFAVLSNHMHVVARTRPDLVKT